MDACQVLDMFLVLVVDVLRKLVENIPEQVLDMRL